MSGKAYTLREMKTIVDYLNTHKAYGEIRGRKLWTDFASTNLTNRTWQSLKETFLKRILPDIHNPYFGLTRSEICSFKQGYDVDSRSNNKLEIQTISDDSNHSHADNVQDNEKPSTSNNVNNKTTGEVMSPSTLDARHRASTETIILENCYETPEDIQRDLESPKSDKGGNKEPSKSLRDLITYAEPLTPMMQQVLDDFATSESEANLEIDENTNNQNDNNKTNSEVNEKSKNQNDNNKTNSEVNKKSENQNDNNKTISEVNKKSEGDKGEKFNSKVEERLSDIIQTADSVKIPLGQESKIAENSTRNSYDLIENGNFNDSKTDDHNVSSNKTNINKKEKNVDLTTQTAPTQNTNNSTDTTIPGNQEALKKNNENTLAADIGNTSKDITKKFELSRKRSNSQHSNSNKEKKKMLGLKNNKKKSQSEPEDKQNSKKVIPKIYEENNTNKELKNQVSGAKQNKEENNLSENYENNAAQINPCLSSVSLYAEQFKKTKYTDSDSSNNVIDAVTNVNKEMKTDEKSPEVLKAAANVNEVVILKSHSESDDSKEGGNVRENKQENIKIPVGDKTERDRALASVFGFASGAVSSTRKRKISRRHRSTSFNHNNVSDSSEWTSESDSEYVSPPRGRRNRHSRKYLKPKSGRILSLEDEGGLFVMHGKRIYPLVRDGKIVKNYLTFSPSSDHEDDPNYWKKKYEDEKKKAEELKKLFEEAQQKKLVREQSPNVPTTSRQSVQRSPPKLVPIPDAAVPLQEPKQVIKAPEKTLKIKFTKNNEELQLEGHWSQIHPVLTDVVQIFNKDSELGKEAEANEPVFKETARKETAYKETAHKETAHKETNGKADDADEILSIRSTPLDEESVRKKVEKMEEEIFKEIEELDKSEREQAAASTTDQESNVNTRKRVGRPRKSSTVTKSADSSSSPSRAKRTRVVKKTEENGPEAATETERPRRQPNTPKKFNSEISTVTKTTEKKTPKKSPRKSSKPEPESTGPTSDDESQTRYMFPPERTQNARKSLVTNKKTNARSLTNPTSENLSLNSIDSTQGYQDSDGSPTNERMMLKRKRKPSLTIMHRGKHRRYTRKRSSPCISDDASSESSNLSFKLQRKSITDSIKSEVYRSESYQMLMPLKKRPWTTLSKIDETNPMNHNADDALKIHVEAVDLKNASGSLDNVRTDGNSSNISLPLSPELSIVENISVSKELINSIGDISSINELQAINEPSSAHNKYMMSAVDVTMPLMGQDCEIQETTSPDHANKSTAKSESLLIKINSVDVTEGPSISDSLHNRLKNLLLESAKKMDLDTLETIHENCDNVAKSNSEIEKKPRGRKRCSTPNKRNSKKKSKTPDIEPVVEEERMEFCSYGGRRSCPPTMQIFPVISNNDTNKSGNEIVKKGRKKKDVIKVKILKPKNKQKKVSPVADNTRSHNVTTVSVHTDSGINETSSALFLQDTDDSVDLIHNHSETCLQTRECISDSIEFVERNTSIISVNSQETIDFRDRAENIRPEVFCNNAHDGSTVTTHVKTINSQSTCDTVYHSPLNSDLSGNSLLTEDLSDENANEVPAPSRSNKWYLLSEDETTNTNHAPSCGANLMQIFPLACAVPDLSTITEMSKEDDSRKPTLFSDGDTRNDLDSQSIF